MYNMVQIFKKLIDINSIDMLFGKCHDPDHISEAESFISDLLVIQIDHLLVTIFS